MSSGAPPYQLTIDGFAPDAFRVRSFTGKETISEAWWFDVAVTAEAGGDTVEQSALGQRATLVFDVGDNALAFYGVVAAVRLTEVHAVDHAVTYLVRVVPRLWLLRRKRRTRIFQKMRVPDVVSSVLLEAGIATRWQLVRAYPEREYLTQYEETDYHFVRRILAEAGISFYFFGGGPVSSGALAADAAVGAAAAVGGSVVGFVAGQGAGALVGAAAEMGETLIPGDTVVGADDAACWPPVAGDDPAALAASTAAAMAPAVGDALGLGDGVAGAAIGAASAVAGAVVAAVTESDRAAPVMHAMANVDARVSTYDKITHFTLRNTVRTSAAAYRAYDPDRPAVLLQSVAVSTQPFPPSPFEAAAEAAAMAENAASVAAAVLPGPAAGIAGDVASAVSTVDAVVNEVGAATGQKVPYEDYEHHDPFLFPKWSLGGDEAPRILRQKRRRASIAKGEGGCTDFSPAHRFTLQDHAAAQLDGDYVITEVEHRGETRPASGEGWRVYWNTFACAPAQMPYPPRRPRRRSVQVALTATVVGPDGEEIYVDEKGQIKVQFHWDRDGQYDENSSCWIRTMQPWAGAAWGHQFIPRVGMEVVVVFEGGDPDKPMVMGSLYNGTHPPPFKLPEQRTRSGIRTQSVPAGTGANELSFEDAGGREQIYVHAQRNYDEVVEASRSSDVHGNSSALVRGNLLEHVDHEARFEVVGDRYTRVDADDRLSVGHALATEVTHDHRIDVGGEMKTKVALGHTLEVRGGHAIVVGTESAPAQLDHYAHGSASLAAKERLVLRAEQGVTLACGDARIDLLPDKIVLTAPTLEMKAGKSLSASTKDGPSMTLGDGAEILAKKLSVFTDGASLELDKDAKVKGGAIKLGYDPSKPDKSDKDDKPETKPLKLKLSDWFLDPYASKKYHLMVEGLRFEGETDGDGGVQQDVPKTAKQAVVRLWTGQFPDGPQQIYRVALGELPPASDLKGAQQRLTNLGYYSGPIDGAQGDELRAAVAEFQRDHADSHALDPTGDLDGGTTGALEEIHGS
jgi:type VI secretion system secreted protein VgrG